LWGSFRLFCLFCYDDSPADKPPDAEQARLADERTGSAIGGSAGFSGFNPALRLAVAVVVHVLATG